MSNSELLAKREQILGKAQLFYREPVQIVRGQGVLLYDQHDQQYIDMYNNVPCVGHGNPSVVAALQQQMAELNVHSRYLHPGIIDFGKRLLDHHADHLDSIVFSCSGTEAVEVALMTARHATGGQGIICTDATYHGNSTEVGKMSARPVSDPRFRSIPFPQSYRPLAEGVTEDELCQLYLNKVEEAIDDFADKDIPFAGMIVCSILANEGLPDIPAGFMSQAAALVRAAGGVFIADEVQAGYCRSGHWWGYQTSDFQPDIVVMGKPMGNGLPLSAVAANHDLIAAFRSKTGYFNTFASSPMQAAVGMAVLDVIEADNLLENATSIGRYLQTELTKLQPDCDAMAEVRGRGLFIGIEWVNDRERKVADRKGAFDVANRMKQKGFLISNAGALGNVVKIRPPLVFKQEHADLFLSAFAEMLTEIKR
ncbi:MAG: aspartate aminotransferase family protein [Gammaproteobacteria bacterium]|jgi:4-aminobutyrate aminotransferase-like enzyme|nr:aspartate aminotransferase family protein [Gammaproteobacteria bacterium]MBT5202588.1 aspartate aminotransferase family protein [Gammaproteobacteria bacterium]MBT5602466.1 aspartate aminotransferase family protein [Gammaproteobacteria bacterium]MBT6245433.1 aspartate aminotransferase family protein [Gammaproteobacteria bacterium]